jgi:carboxypeptidase Taq
MAAMHEGGHALYELGLPKAYARQPVGGDAGAAVHESQAMIIEMQACRSDPYLGWLGQQLLGTFGGDSEAYTRDNLVRIGRQVRPSFIRVDADEVTYPLHIILRYRLEQALIAGNLAVADLPGAWNDEMQKLLGIRPQNDVQGCLQDIHWYSGLFGYFPSYALGMMAAAQFMAAARRATPGIDQALAEGEVGPLVGWLRIHVHGMGNLLGANDLLRAATGRPLDAKDFVAHIKARYAD